jgi:hypothetical protein
MQRGIEREASGNAVERIPVQRCAIEGAVMFAVVHLVELRMAQIILNLRLTLRHRVCCAAANRQMEPPVHVAIWEAKRRRVAIATSTGAARSHAVVIARRKN